LAFHSGREADHSPRSSAEVKEWVPPLPQLGGAQRHTEMYVLNLF
jgi:hypothetical protein